MNISFRTRKYNEYIIVQPVLDGIVHQEEWMDAEEYANFVESVKNETDELTRWLGKPDE